MSLLNDALRQAEQRQNKPQVSAAYTGQTAQTTGGSRAVPVLIVLLVLALLAAGIAWWLLAKNSAGPTIEATETVAPSRGFGQSHNKGSQLQLKSQPRSPR